MTTEVMAADHRGLERNARIGHRSEATFGEGGSGGLFGLWEFWIRKALAAGTGGNRITLMTLIAVTHPWIANGALRRLSRRRTKFCRAKGAAQRVMGRWTTGVINTIGGPKTAAFGSPKQQP